MAHKSSPTETPTMAATDVQVEFGRRVQEFRKRKGLTQEQLAEEIGKSVDTISNIERGFSSTRIQTAAAIATALGIELRDLFTTGARTDQERRREDLSRVILKLVGEGDDEALEAISEVVNSILKLRRGSP